MFGNNNAFAALRIAIILVVLLSVGVRAKSDIQIKRPVDGSTVRETVNILVPVSSVPDNGFVSYIIDGQFKVAIAAKTEDGNYFMYAWDTPAKVKDGSHTIGVQAYGGDGNAVGDVKTITVHVKNEIPTFDLPAGGIRLRYKYKAGEKSRYTFDWRIDLNTVKGLDKNLVGAFGYGIEGATGKVSRLAEYITDEGGPFICEQGYGLSGQYKGGRLMPGQKIDGKRLYRAEDDLGKPSAEEDLGTDNWIPLSNPGTPVQIVLPVLPSRPVLVGDTWRDPTKIFWDPQTGKSVEKRSRNMFERLQWKFGYPCAVISTTFSGSVTIPFSKVFTNPVTVDGETITYFCYTLGKVILSETTATAQGSANQPDVYSALQAALPKSAGPLGQQPNQAGSGGGYQNGYGNMPPGMAGRMPPGMAGGPGYNGMGPGMPGMPGTGPGMPGMGPGTMSPGMGPNGEMGPMGHGGLGMYPGAGNQQSNQYIVQKTDVEFKITQSIELLR